MVNLYFVEDVTEKNKKVDFYLTSDFHNELILSDRKCKVPFFKPSPIDNGNYKVLIVAGDAWSLKKRSHAISWLEEVSALYDCVIYVMGNHEFYDARIHYSEIKLKEETAHIKNTFILEDESLVLDICGKKYGFIGSTLWVNFGNDPKIEFDLSERVNGRSKLSDFTYIRNARKGTARLTPNDVKIKNSISKEYIFETIPDLKKFCDFVFVVTHHPPSTQSEDVEYKGELGNKYLLAFSNNLDYQIAGANPDYWLHGHTHKNFRYKIPPYSNGVGTEVICNPVGYHTERNKYYSNDPVITLDIY